MRLEEDGVCGGVVRRILSDADGVQLVREVDTSTRVEWWSVRTDTQVAATRTTLEAAERVANTMREWARARRVAAVERGE